MSYASASALASAPPPLRPPSLSQALRSQRDRPSSALEWAQHHAPQLLPEGARLAPGRSLAQCIHALHLELDLSRAPCQLDHLCASLSLALLHTSSPLDAPTIEALIHSLPTPLPAREAAALSRALSPLVTPRADALLALLSARHLQALARVFARIALPWEEYAAPAPLTAVARAADDALLARMRGVAGQSSRGCAAAEDSGSDDSPTRPLASAPVPPSSPTACRTSALLPTPWGGSPLQPLRGSPLLPSLLPPPSPAPLLSLPSSSPTPRVTLSDAATPEHRLKLEVILRMAHPAGERAFRLPEGPWMPLAETLGVQLPYGPTPPLATADAVLLEHLALFSSLPRLREAVARGGLIFCVAEEWRRGGSKTSLDGHGDVAFLKLTPATLTLASWQAARSSALPPLQLRSSTPELRLSSEGGRAAPTPLYAPPSPFAPPQPEMERLTHISSLIPAESAGLLQAARGLAATLSFFNVETKFLPAASDANLQKRRSRHRVKLDSQAKLYAGILQQELAFDEQLLAASARVTPLGCFNASSNPSDLIIELHPTGGVSQELRERYRFLPATTLRAPASPLMSSPATGSAAPASAFSLNAGSAGWGGASSSRSGGWGSARYINGQLVVDWKLLYPDGRMPRQRKRAKLIRALESELLRATGEDSAAILRRLVTREDDAREDDAEPPPRS